MTEHNVHAILSRCAAPELEQYGIVWVGAKGIYALKEHGYERPPMRLFDAVSKIVQEKYNNNQRPIHITAIASALPMHHPTVNRASLTFRDVNERWHPAGNQGLLRAQGRARERQRRGCCSLFG